MNNVIMCMSILVDRGCVTITIILMVTLHLLLAKKTLPYSKLHKKSIPSAQKSTKSILKQSSSPVIYFLWSEQIFIDNQG